MKQHNQSTQKPSDSLDKFYTFQTVRQIYGDFQCKLETYNVNQIQIVYILEFQPNISCYDTNWNQKLQYEVKITQKSLILPLLFYNLKFNFIILLKLQENYIASSNLDLFFTEQNKNYQILKFKSQNVRQDQFCVFISKSYIIQNQEGKTKKNKEINGQHAIYFVNQRVQTRHLDVIDDLFNKIYQYFQIYQKFQLNDKQKYKIQFYGGEDVMSYGNLILFPFIQFNTLNKEIVSDILDKLLTGVCISLVMKEFNNCELDNKYDRSSCSLYQQILIYVGLLRFTFYKYYLSQGDYTLKCKLQALEFNTHIQFIPKLIQSQERIDQDRNLLQYLTPDRYMNFQHFIQERYIQSYDNRYTCNQYKQLLYNFSKYWLYERKVQQVQVQYQELNQEQDIFDAGPQQQKTQTQKHNEQQYNCSVLFTKQQSIENVIYNKKLLLRCDIIAQFIIENAENYKKLISQMFRDDFNQLTKLLIQNTTQRQRQGVGTSLQKYDCFENKQDEDLEDNELNNENISDSVLSRLILILEQWDQPMYTIQLLDDPTQNRESKGKTYSVQIPDDFTMYCEVDNSIQQITLPCGVIRNVQFIDPNNILPFQIVIANINDNQLMTFIPQNTYKSVLESLDNACFQHKIYDWYRLVNQSEIQLQTLMQPKVFQEYQIIQVLYHQKQNDIILKHRDPHFNDFKNPIIQFIYEYATQYNQIRDKIQTTGNIDMNQVERQLQQFDTHLQYLLQSFVKNLQHNAKETSQNFNLFFKYLPFIEQLDLQIYVIIYQSLIDINKYFGYNDDLVIQFYKSFVFTLLNLLYQEKKQQSQIINRINTQAQLLRKIQIKQQNSHKVNYEFTKLLVLINQIQYQFGFNKVLQEYVPSYKQLIDLALSQEIYEPLKFFFTNAKVTLNPKTSLINFRMNIEMLPIGKITNLCYLQLVQQNFISFRDPIKYAQQNEEIFCPFCHYQTNHQNCIGEAPDNSTVVNLYSPEKEDIIQLSQNIIEIQEYLQTKQQQFWKNKDFAILYHNFISLRSLVTQYIQLSQSQQEIIIQDSQNKLLKCIESTNRIHSYGTIM